MKFLDNQIGNGDVDWFGFRCRQINKPKLRIIGLFKEQTEYMHKRDKQFVFVKFRNGHHYKYFHLIGFLMCINTH